ncbi:glycerol-3-phosphate dehydrogenase/oxidase [Leifsonia sp. H3M29-4]|uniref:glycerol-3-phosphate dehydrogenase/oxidase n=1 Tax=Salinibacterium metalliresistens TaxID=3031321 RepID=UPI0023DB3CF4|nr:glycerol-3-phosphate dehydrogenase/oxidase [Salinibacterium metalliresistens]MDF1478524.1 glycerol-3-phosphate dehydrogenase/oxidase [Salinibacterium metalliresistens]
MAGSSRERAEVAALRDRPSASVLIIGGGINGIATFRELALSGVDVVLVERGDFASGASAASSHMIHGGIRYLENGELRLVRESVIERNRLLRIAPHFVRPLQTTIPIYSTFSGILAAPLRLLTHRQRKPAARGALLIKVGLVLYDLFSRDGGRVPRHRFAGRSASLAALPQLDPKVAYTATYFDASVHEPERLALDMLLDGLAAGSHARAVNYAEAVGTSGDAVIVEDRETGERIELVADVVINASGPWTDLTNDALGRPTALLGGTKGSHIVLDHPQLLAATAGREIFFEHQDGRIVLIYPLKDRVLVGTTDTVADVREPARCTEEDVDYFFELIAHVFPGIAVQREQIVYRYAGIRPLPRHEDLAPGFISRDYRIEHDPEGSGRAGTLSLVGGKWTTCRALGATLAGRALELLGRTSDVDTSELAIGGGRDYPGDATARDAWCVQNLPGLSEARARVLFDRYGTRAAAVAAWLAQGPDREVLGDVLSVRELAYMGSTERALHLRDVVLRRTNLAFVGAADASALDEVAAAMREALDWSAERLADEIAECVRELTDLHGVEFDAMSR